MYAFRPMHILCERVFHILRTYTMASTKSSMVGGEGGGWGWLRKLQTDSPVQNRGSSDISPQSSTPSQYLSGETHLLLRHTNCDIRQVYIMAGVKNNIAKPSMQHKYFIPRKFTPAKKKKRTHS